MNVEAITLADVDYLRKIHHEHYKDEFEFPDLFSKFLSAFVITNGDDEIICGGGVRTIVESVIITDKDCSAWERREALYEMLRVSVGTIKSQGYNQLHAFIQDEKWMNHLKKAGFVETKGKSLVLTV